MENARTFPAPPPPTKPSLSTHFPPPPPTTTRVQTPISYKLPPGQPRIGDLVQEAFDAGYSDVHVGVGETPRFRNRGEIETTNYPETDLPTFMAWLHEVLSEEEIRTFQANLDFDGATQYEFARVRINLFDSSTVMGW
jgi:twitching motility protein PilT